MPSSTPHLPVLVARVISLGARGFTGCQVANHIHSYWQSAANGKGRKYPPLPTPGITASGYTFPTVVTHISTFTIPLCVRHETCSLLYPFVQPHSAPYRPTCPSLLCRSCLAAGLAVYSPTLSPVFCHPFLTRVRPPPFPPPRAQSLATVCDLLTLLKVGSGLASTVNNPYASLLTGGSSASNTALIKLLE